MSKVLQSELSILKEHILSLGEKVEGLVKTAMIALETKDKALADEVFNSEELIDKEEIKIEEECLKILALHQPVANDLRFIIAVLKMNNDLERIADVATSVARRTLRLIEIGYAVAPEELILISEHVKSMLRKSLLALLEMDTNIARGIVETESSVHQLNKNSYHKFISVLPTDLVENHRNYLFLSIGKRLERIADLTTNLAEDLVYIVEGEIIRHGKGKI